MEDKPITLDEAAEKEVMIQAFDKVRQLFERRSWIMDGRGNYRYDDDSYKHEVRYMYDEFDALQKDVWKNIKSKSVDFRNKVIAEWQSQQPKVTERPEIKDFFGPDVNVLILNDIFLANPELYMYISALDSYIDKLESQQKPTGLNSLKILHFKFKNNPDTPNWIINEIAATIKVLDKKLEEGETEETKPVEDKETQLEPIQNALYATGRFTTDECNQLAEGILIYINDSKKQHPVEDKKGETFENIKWQVGSILMDKLFMSIDGLGIEANPAAHAIAEYICRKFIKQHPVEDKP